MTTSTKERDSKRVAEVTDTSARLIETCSVNDGFRQGDLEIRFLGDCPHGLVDTNVPSQLAPGTTKGSRHILVGDPEIKAFAFATPSELEGPVLCCPNGLTVEHPEHGDVTIREPGYYAITYQRAFADEIRRQQD